MAARANTNDSTQNDKHHTATTDSTKRRGPTTSRSSQPSIPRSTIKSRGSKARNNNNKNETNRDDKDDGNTPEAVTRCVCGSEEDFGTMVQCEGCLVWQHTECMEVSRVPRNYFCELCRPDLHPFFQWERNAPHTIVERSNATSRRSSSASTASSLPSSTTTTATTTTTTTTTATATTLAHTSSRATATRASPSVRRAARIAAAAAAAAERASRNHNDVDTDNNDNNNHDIPRNKTKRKRTPSTSINGDGDNNDDNIVNGNGASSRSNSVHSRSSSTSPGNLPDNNDVIIGSETGTNSSSNSRKLRTTNTSTSGTRRASLSSVDNRGQTRLRDRTTIKNDTLNKSRSESPTDRITDITKPRITRGSRTKNQSKNGREDGDSIGDLNDGNDEITSRQLRQRRKEQNDETMEDNNVDVDGIDQDNDEQNVSNKKERGIKRVQKDQIDIKDEDEDEDNEEEIEEMEGDYDGDDVVVDDDDNDGSSTNRKKSRRINGTVSNNVGRRGRSRVTSRNGSITGDGNDRARAVIDSVLTSTNGRVKRDTSRNNSSMQQNQNGTLHDTTTIEEGNESNPDNEEVDGDNVDEEQQTAQSLARATSVASVAPSSRTSRGVGRPATNSGTDGAICRALTPPIMVRTVDEDATIETMLARIAQIAIEIEYMANEYSALSNLKWEIATKTSSDSVDEKDGIENGSVDVSSGIDLNSKTEAVIAATKAAALAVDEAAVEDDLDDDEYGTIRSEKAALDALVSTVTAVEDKQKLTVNGTDIETGSTMGKEQRTTTPTGGIDFGLLKVRHALLEVESLVPKTTMEDFIAELRELSVPDDSDNEGSSDKEDDGSNDGQNGINTMHIGAEEVEKVVGDNEDDEEEEEEDDDASSVSSTISSIGAVSSISGGSIVVDIGSSIGSLGTSIIDGIEHSQDMSAINDNDIGNMHGDISQVTNTIVDSEVTAEALENARLARESRQRSRRIAKLSDALSVRQLESVLGPIRNELTRWDKVDDDDGIGCDEDITMGRQLESVLRASVLLGRTLRSLV